MLTDVEPINLSFDYLNTEIERTLLKLLSEKYNVALV